MSPESKGWTFQTLEGEQSMQTFDIYTLSYRSLDSFTSAVSVERDSLLLEEVNRELKRIHIDGCRYNERLNVKTEGSKHLVGTG